MSLMFEPLRRYADFEGRSRRSEYWLFILFRLMLYAGLWIAAIVAMGVMQSATGDEGAGNAAGGLFLALFFIAMLAMIVPSLAVSVRRLHDIDMSGWWLLLAFVPLGGFVVFIFTLIEGTAGKNRYGRDPKRQSSNDTLLTPTGPAAA